MKHLNYLKIQGFFTLMQSLDKNIIISLISLFVDKSKYYSV